MIRKTSTLAILLSIGVGGIVSINTMQAGKKSKTQQQRDKKEKEKQEKELFLRCEQANKKQQDDGAQLLKTGSYKNRFKQRSIKTLENYLGLLTTTLTWQKSELESCKLLPEYVQLLKKQSHLQREIQGLLNSHQLGTLAQKEPYGAYLLTIMQGPDHQEERQLLATLMGTITPDFKTLDKNLIRQCQNNSPNDWKHAGVIIAALKTFRKYEAECVKTDSKIKDLRNRRQNTFEKDLLKCCVVEKYYHFFDSINSICEEVEAHTEQELLEKYNALIEDRTKDIAGIETELQRLKKAAQNTVQPVHIENTSTPEEKTKKTSPKKKKLVKKKSKKRDQKQTPKPVQKIVLEELATPEKPVIKTCEPEVELQVEIQPEITKAPETQEPIAHESTLQVGDTSSENTSTRPETSGSPSTGSESPTQEPMAGKLEEQKPEVISSTMQETREEQKPKITQLPLEEYIQYEQNEQKSPELRKQKLAQLFKIMQQKHGVFGMIAIKQEWKTLREQCRQKALQLGAFFTEKDRHVPCFAGEKESQGLSPEEKAVLEYYWGKKQTVQLFGNKTIEYREATRPGSAEFCLTPDEQTAVTKVGQGEKSSERAKELATLLVTYGTRFGFVRTLCKQGYTKHLETIRWAALSKAIKNLPLTPHGKERYTNNWRPIIKEYMSLTDKHADVPDETKLVQELEIALESIPKPQ